MTDETVESVVVDEILPRITHEDPWTLEEILTWFVDSGREMPDHDEVIAILRQHEGVVTVENISEASRGRMDRGNALIRAAGARAK